MLARVAAALAGIWLLAAPDLLGYDSVAATAHHILGPIAAAFAVIAIWEATRSLRWVSLPIGLVLLVLPWVLAFDVPSAVNSVVAGVVLVASAFAQGETGERFAGGWRSLWPPCSGEPRADR